MEVVMSLIKMSQEEASEIYYRWRRRATSVVRVQFDKMFEDQPWIQGEPGWGRCSKCGKFVVVVTEKSIRLIEPNLTVRRTGVPLDK